MSSTTTVAAPASAQVRPLPVAAGIGIVYVVWARPTSRYTSWSRTCPPLLGAGTRAITAGLLVAGACWAFGEHVDPLAISFRSWAAWGYLVVVGSIAFATYAYVNPMVAMALGWLILAEPSPPPLLSAVRLS